MLQLVNNSKTPAVVITKSLTQRIIDWNRVRNNLKYDIDLEIKMLSEEAREFYMAETLVDRLDALVDFLFVSTGTVAKFMAIQHKYGKDFSEDHKEMVELAQWCENQKSQMLLILKEEIGLLNAEVYNDESQLLNNIIFSALEIVITANEKKGTTLVDGKIAKGDEYVKPEPQLEIMLQKFLGGSYVKQV